LNYGHTFCHAIEAVSGYGRFLHGEAVSIGMHCAAILAENLGRTEPSLRLRQSALLLKLRLPVTLPEIDSDQLLAAMQRDKKVEHGALRFILPRCLGSVELVGGVAEDAVRRTLQSARTEVSP
jgi:3-dehydroquinate synthase